MFNSQSNARIRRLENRVAALEAALVALGGRLPAPEELLSDRVKALADRGRLVAAIKAHREDTGAGLVEAKEAVEAYARRG